MAFSPLTPGTQPLSHLSVIHRTQFAGYGKSWRFALTADDDPPGSIVRNHSDKGNPLLRRTGKLGYSKAEGTITRQEEHRPIEKSQSSRHRSRNTPPHNATGTTGQPMGWIAIPAQDHVSPLADVTTVNQEKRVVRDHLP